LSLLSSSSLHHNTEKPRAINGSDKAETTGEEKNTQGGASEFVRLTKHYLSRRVTKSRHVTDIYGRNS
jgi:hypothetical protein